MSTEDNKPNIPKGSIEPPIIRLDASRQDRTDTVALSAKDGSTRIIVGNTKPPATKPPEKRQE